MLDHVHDVRSFSKRPPSLYAQVGMAMRQRTGWKTLASSHDIQDEVAGRLVCWGQLWELLHFNPLFASCPPGSVGLDAVMTGTSRTGGGL